MSAAFALMLLALIQAAAPAASPDRAARIERFLAALPGARSEAEPRDDDARGHARLEAMLAGNRSKEAVIRRIWSDRSTCTAKTGRDATVTALRRTADRLSDDELDRLTLFYSGPDYRAMDAKQGAPDAAVMADLMKRYPLQRMLDATQAVLNQDMPDSLMASLEACDATADAALAQAGVKID